LAPNCSSRQDSSWYTHYLTFQPWPPTGASQELGVHLPPRRLLLIDTGLTPISELRTYLEAIAN